MHPLDQKKIGISLEAQFGLVNWSCDTAQGSSGCVYIRGEFGVDGPMGLAR
jgi:hypothetical protein